MKTTDIDRQQTLENRVREIYREAIHFKWNSDEIGQRYDTRILQSTEYKRLPQYRRAIVRAIYMFLFHGPADMSIYQHLEYRMLGPDGKYYKDFDTWRALFPQGNAALIDGGAHFWKGTDKVFFTSAKEDNANA